MAHLAPTGKTLESYEKSFKDKAKPQENPCVFVYILSGALNCQYCIQGCSKNSPSNVHLLPKGVRSFVRMMRNGKGEKL